MPAVSMHAAALRRSPSLVLLLLVASLTAASCRGADESSVDTTLTTPAPTTTTTFPAPTSTAPASTSTTAPAPTTTTTILPLDPLQGLDRETLATGLSQPTFVTARPGDGRLFVLERVGRVRVIDPATGVLPDPFLNIRNKVGSSSVEQGLLGLAFHPSYETNGRFFIYYTDRAGDSVLAEYGVGDDPNRAVETEERIVLEIAQPDERHNAGMLEFGPDGYLYIGLGDGGAGAASVNGQNPHTLLAAILRLDVDGAAPYAIPEDNPFADGVNGAPEVWAYGLRNPWRFSIDPVENLLYIGDVGQQSREEIDVVALEPAGYNFGWPSMEGSSCFFESNCDPADYESPVVDYDHGEGLSVTGGYVYRGAAIPELTGHYFYADWVTEWIRSFRHEAGTVTDVQDWTSDLHPGQITSFGLDGAGELLIATWVGEIARIIPLR